MTSVHLTLSSDCGASCVTSMVDDGEIHINKHICQMISDVETLPDNEGTHRVERVNNTLFIPRFRPLKAPACSLIAVSSAMFNLHRLVTILSISQSIFNYIAPHSKLECIQSALQVMTLHKRQTE